MFLGLQNNELLFYFHNQYKPYHQSLLIYRLQCVHLQIQVLHILLQQYQDHHDHLAVRRLPFLLRHHLILLHLVHLNLFHYQ